MSHIQEEIHRIQAELSEGVRLVAVSKYHPVGALIEAYEAGQRIFGESKVQEMTQKHEALPKDIEWHFIGHLQKNKVKYIAPYVALIHGIDSYKLLAEVDKQAEKAGRVIPCLLQIHIAQEETKFGFSPDECMAMLDEGTWRTLTHVQIAGLMGMATYTDNHEQIIREFSTLSSLFQKLKETHFKDEPAFCELSMGMSGDYPLAISQGSTLIRIGSRIFGARQY
jgi:pyridoxal phosphate enzyme (YggS family)